MKKKIIGLMVLVLLCTTPVTFADELNSPLDYMRLLIDLVRENYKDDIDEGLLYEGAYKGIFQVLDRHSKYYTEEEYNAFVDVNSGSYYGVGITLNTDFKVIAITAGSPADLSGIHLNDMIISIDTIPVDGKTLDEVNGSINGDEGTEVVLSIKREGYLNPLVFKMQRAKVVVQSVEYEMIDTLAYFRIISFNENVYEQTLEALAYFDSHNYQGIIIDVRDNPGGSLEAVVDVADLFLPVGADIVHMKYKNQAGKTYFSQTMPLETDCVVLINHQSASASEIFASAMKGHDQAILVGDRTFGKGTVQTLYQLTNLAGLKLTIGEFKGAGNEVIDGLGIEPDYYIYNVDQDQDILNQLVPMNERGKKTYGDISLNVYGVQQRLKALGYTVDVDGIYGPQTERALFAYKDKKGLEVNRIIDSAVIYSLKRDIEDLKSGNGEDFQLEKAIALLKESLQ